MFRISLIHFLPASFSFPVYDAPDDKLLLLADPTLVSVMKLFCGLATYSDHILNNCFTRFPWTGTYIDLGAVRCFLFFNDGSEIRKRALFGVALLLFAHIAKL